jgi:hypothetical protein
MKPCDDAFRRPTMSELHQAFHRALDGLVDERAETGDWGRVVTDADRGNRRAWVLRIAVVGVAAAVAVGAALVSPLEDEQPTGVIGRALAAIGDGPVIHLVTRGDWGGTLVDLSTGEVTPVYAESEVWYDATRGAHFVSRFGDKVTADGVVEADEVPQQQAVQYVALANRYRDELSSGKAKVVARGTVDGRPVRWIRLGGEWFPRVDDGRLHLHAEEVAVDATTFEPVYMRRTDDGRPVEGTGQLIIELETLPAGEGDFSADSAHARGPLMGGAGLGRHLSRSQLAQSLGGKALWLGSEHAGKPLAESRTQEFKSRKDPDADWDVVEGVSLYYGSFAPRRGGIRIRDDKKPFVQILQATRPAPMWRGAELAADVPEGSLLVDAGGTGFLRRDGVLVSVSAPEVRDVLTAAVALRRVGAEAPFESAFDIEQVAGMIRPGQLVQTEGFAPVRPRSLVRSNAKAIQRGGTRGVKVVVYEGGGARFDTTGMEPTLQRVMPEQLQARCFKLIGRDRQSNGAYGTAPKNGRRSIALLAQPQHGRIPVAAGPFDACELGGQFGRNWLPRFDWHWPLEIPLTERGRQFFEERAAAIELGHFVRNGARKRARTAMKRGAPAPSATTLRDPARPYIRVSANGDRFTASLTASTGRRFFVEIERGRIARTNARRLAFIR